MTNSPQFYLRQCNKQPSRGVPVTRATVESILALARIVQPIAGVAIAGNLETGLTIRIPGRMPWEVEIGGTETRTFTYMPLPTTPA